MLLLPLCFACGSNESAGQAAGADDALFVADDLGPLPSVSKAVDTTVPNVCEGAVQTDYTLDVVETVFVEGQVDMGTTAPVLVVVQSSIPGICTHLQNGTYPKDGTFFPMALIQADGKKIAAERVYRPSNPDDKSTDQYFVFAQLRHFDNVCAIEPAAEAGLAVLGQMVLDSYSEKSHVTGRYAYQMGEARDALKGSFDASFCDAPNIFVDYMTLLNPEIDSDHCL